MKDDMKHKTDRVLKERLPCVRCGGSGTVAKLNGELKDCLHCKGTGYEPNKLRDILLK